MTNAMETSIILIVPAYNEEENISLFVQEAERNLKDFHWGVIFVNDGSTDGTWRQICKAAETDSRVHGLAFSRNFGHQNALKAGLEEAGHLMADVYITLDADLQHPLTLIPEMVKKWKEGVHIVQAQRDDTGRPISWLKKLTSRAFYKAFSWLSGIPMQPGMSDFRLVDRPTLEFVLKSGDKDFFLRGMLPWSGLSTTFLPYTPAEREHGESKFTIRKMCALAMSGIVGYSTRPLYVAIFIGLLAIAMAALYMVYVIVVSCLGLKISMGWPSIIACILGLGGLQLFIMGILGIYLGKLFMEQKSRPTYVVAERTGTTN